MVFCICFYCLKTEIKNFFDIELPKYLANKFFVGYELQILRKENMKSKESPTAFRKDMDEIFLTIHHEQSTSLVPQSLMKTCHKKDWFLFFFRRLIRNYVAWL